MKKKISEMTFEELSGMVSKASSAIEFYNESRFYCDVMEPAIVEEIDRLNAMMVWNPNMPSNPTDVGMLTGYYSGEIKGLLFIEKMTERILRDKNEAQKELNRRTTVEK